VPGLKILMAGEKHAKMEIVSLCGGIENVSDTGSYPAREVGKYFKAVPFRGFR
jgi:ABC-type hemin transport system substrate-binding protein